MSKRFCVSVIGVMTGLMTASNVFAQGRAAEPRVTVFVTSAGAVDGRTDPNKDNKDTVADLQNALDDQKNVQLVATREDATIVLVVQNRERAQTTAAMFGGQARDVGVRVTLHCAGQEADLIGTAQGGTLSTGGAWKRAAGKVAKQVSTWIQENRETLATR